MCDTITNDHISSISDVVTTYRTTSTFTTTANNTNISCSTSNTSILTYTTSPTSYAQQIYNYTASFTGIVVLEFGFKAQNSVKTWHLDDVSIVGVGSSAFSSQLLVNGGFESGNLTGWQVVCSSTNCGGVGGSLTESNCHTGSYCYVGACAGAYDFLRQSFNVIRGQMYTLSFWIMTAGNPQQAAYVDIRQA